MRIGALICSLCIFFVYFVYFCRICIKLLIACLIPKAHVTVAYVQPYAFAHLTRVSTRQMTLNNVHNAVNSMRKHVLVGRQHAVADGYLITTNNSFVQNWSIVMCFLICITSGIQVLFVRRLFSVPNVTPTAKPRA